MPRNDDGVQCTVRVEVDPKEIEDCVNPLNWKKHPKRQQEYVGSSIDAHGWVGNPTFNARTMKLVNGHGRLEISLAKRYKSIPIDVGYWSEEDEREILISLDSTGQMASIDGNALSSLAELNLKRLQNSPAAKFRQERLDMARDIHSHGSSILAGKKKAISIGKSKTSISKITKIKEVNHDNRITGSDSDNLYHRELRNDILFPSSNQWGIPDLLPSKLYIDKKTLPEGTFTRTHKTLLDSWWYCESSRPFDSANHKKPIGGFLGFFTEDYFFEKYYFKANTSAERLVDEQWFAIIEPDYSTYIDWPFSMRLWSVYRSRWCCRYWQELGMRVIPIIRRTTNLKADAPWLYDTLLPPEKNKKVKQKTVPIVAMHLRMGGVKNRDDINYWNSIAASLEYCKQKLGIEKVLFYGPASYESYIIGRMPEGVSYRMVEPFITLRSRWMSRKRKDK